MLLLSLSRNWSTLFLGNVIQVGSVDVLVNIDKLTIIVVNYGSMVTFGFSSW